MHVDVWETIYSFSMIAERGVISELSKTMQETFRPRFERKVLSLIFRTEFAVIHRKVNTKVTSTESPNLSHG